MGTTRSPGKDINLNSHAGRFRATCVTRLLPLLLLVTLPDVVQAEDYTYATNSGKITITGYIGIGSVVNIPSMINALPVTRIGDGAFINKFNLTSVTIPNSVVSIGGWAFENCTSLTNVTIPHGVTNVGGQAFQNCTSLTSVTIPDTVTSALAGTGGSYMFKGCTSLTNITIGSGLTGIGVGMFYDCVSLPSITIGSGVTIIRPNAFRNCTSLTSITIPSSVTWIQDFVFCCDHNLTTVMIGGGSMQLGEDMFHDCTNMTGVYFQGNAPIHLGANVFSGAPNMTIYYASDATGWTDPFFGRSTVPLPYHYVIDNGTVTITEYIGTGGAVTIPDRIGFPVTGIGSNAFAGCTNLINVTIPAGVTNMGDGAFQDCANLTGVYFSGSAPTLGGSSVFSGANGVTVYHLWDAWGWPLVPFPWAGRPTAVWVTVEVNTCNEADLDAALASPVRHVSFTCDGTIDLTATKMVSLDKTLDASGHSVTISGSNAVRVLTVNPGVRLTLLNLTIANGSGTNRGGGIHNNGGVVAALDCTFSNNTVVGAANGGNAFGGGICSDGGSLIVSNCTFANNRAIGGIGSTGVAGSSSGNPGGTGGNGGCGYGGSLCNNGGIVGMVNCTFNSNRAIGGVGGVGGRGGDGYQYWVPTGPGSGYWVTVPGGYGGKGGDGGDGLGGCLYNALGTATVNNVTMARGSAMSASGGSAGSPGTYGVGSYGPGSPGYSSYGGNIRSVSGSVASKNTIIAYGTRGGISNNCSGAVVDSGNNLCSDTTAVFSSPTSLNNTDPLLATELAASGGPTMTIALLNQSPAIDAGDDALAPAMDQRHVPRAGRSDIGAYEFQMPVIGVSGDLAFGNVVVGTASAATMTIANNGNATMTVTGITCPTGFSGAWGGTIAAGKATNVTVTFSPVALTTYSGAVTVNTDATSGTATISASGTGTAHPLVQGNDGRFGVGTNGFGFNITGASNLVIVVEACTNLLNHVWSPVGTNILTGNSSDFGDLRWTNYPVRFYRLCVP